MGQMQCLAVDNEPVECSDCEWRGIAADLDMISDFEERVSAGETCPAGECPECGALAHLIEEEAVPTPPKPARVIVATWSHKHGDDVRVFASDDGAEAWRQEIAAECYGFEFGAEESDYPADASEMADAYFDRMNERGDESFNTESCEVEPDPAPASEESTCAEIKAAMAADAR